jgi:hypothetical protein
LEATSDSDEELHIGPPVPEFAPRQQQERQKTNRGEDHFEAYFEHIWSGAESEFLERGESQEFCDYVKGVLRTGIRKQGEREAKLETEQRAKVARIKLLRRAADANGSISVNNFSSIHNASLSSLDNLIELLEPSKDDQAYHPPGVLEAVEKRARARALRRANVGSLDIVDAVADTPTTRSVEIQACPALELKAEEQLAVLRQSILYPYELLQSHQAQAVFELVTKY